MFDLFIFGLPLIVFKFFYIISEERFVKMMTVLIHWTTPIVYAFPLIFSGSKIYCDDLDLLIQARENNSILIANHGSRIDWMVAMFCGHNKVKGQSVMYKARVGFVCESFIKYMPIIGWYRAFICEDIFVDRSISSDAPVIKTNVQKFLKAKERRMTFLSPEGVVVDYGEMDKFYIQSCRNYCEKLGYKSFEYVLTPRHKGTECLLNNMHVNSKNLVSVCLAYVQNGKLLNCKMSSPSRVIPDIYLLNKGMFEHPIDVYICMRPINLKTNAVDLRTAIMNEYKWMDDILKEFDKQDSTINLERALSGFNFSLIEPNIIEALAYHVLHAFVIIITAVQRGLASHLYSTFISLLFVVSSCYTVGWMMNSTSMESVPFETCIKSTFLLLQNRKKRLLQSKSD